MCISEIDAGVVPMRLEEIPKTFHRVLCELEVVE
jgi:hypothetical protein